MLPKLENLKAAWIVLLIDNVPPQIRPSDDEWFEKAEHPLHFAFQTEDLVVVDCMIGALRTEGDITNINSPLWQLCAGDEDEREKYGNQEINNVLDWMFDNIL